VSAIRVGKQRGYTMVFNDLLPADGSLSARAWGIYVYLIGRPEGWLTSSLHLSRVFREGRDSIRAALRELCDAGLMVRETYRDGNLTRTRFAVPGTARETDSQAPEEASQVTTDLPRH